MTLIAGAEIAWAARQHGDREALIVDGRSWSFREVNARANRLANALRAAGLGTGDRVGVLVANSLEAVDCNFGLLKGGFASVPLNVRHTVLEHRDVLVDSGCAAIVAGPEFADTAAALAGTVPELGLVLGVGWDPPKGGRFERFLAEASDAEPMIRVGPHDLMRLTYTSGTTGKPKGVVGTHGRHLARLANFFASLEYALWREHTMLHVGPLSHVAGNYLLPCFIRGARGVVLRAFDPIGVQKTIERYRVNHALIVPTMIVRLVAELRPDRYDLSSLTRINYGTAPIPVEVLRRGIAALGPVFRQHYGMSEANSPLTVLYPDEHVLDGPPEVVARLASCGRPVAGLRIEVRDGHDRPLAPGEVGEICIEATGAAEVEYWRRPDLTAEAVRDGWFHTGDLGRFDEEGYLFIVGRTKDMIITGGYNVYAREVEDCLFQHPGVLEAAVVGVQDPEWGEVVAAMVVPKAGTVLTVDALQAHCRARISGYKLPRLVVIADELPKTASGKVAKQEVRAMVTARHDATAEAGATTGVMTRY